MVSAYLKSVDHPSAWRGSNFSSIDDVSFVLESHHLAALDKALKSVRAAGLTLNSVEKEDFDLSPIADDIEQIKNEILYGRGIVILRNFPVHDYSLEDVEILYWGFGCHLGLGESQSSMGDRLGHVRDVSGKDRNERAYRNSVDIMLHTDLADIVGMLSINKSERGGLSTYTSAVALHNEILATRPDYLEPLYQGFRYHRFGEQAPGEPPVTDHRVPVLSQKADVVSARFVPEYVYMAAEELGEPIPPFDRAALEYFNDLACSPELRFDVMLAPGDLSLINNYTVLHARDAFYDGDEAHQKRLLLRLWLSTDHNRPLVENLEIFTRRGIAPQQRESTYYTGVTDTASKLGHS
jgi:hypothetical protein